jgi:hypothetical protein
MMRKDIIQDVIVQQVRVTQEGQRCYFQMQLPRHAQRIVGVEMGCCIDPYEAIDDREPSPSLFTIQRNECIGVLQLQTTGQPNFCFVDELVQTDNNLVHADVTTAIFNKIQSHQRQATHGGRHEITTLLLPPATTIAGLYIDRLNQGASFIKNYTVTIYLWFEFEQD